mmetsp:Transcript_27235/g.37566  ORF Transcript_27235/g.37566 Transcript_27235/m.37566 type:complete len:291 (-) Transcript_27235:126-998(-)|eukprot:CAMPEP_0196595378 /NCGR_PEP_ID=MMETSP1081-20130531/80939_1 /TAXON_ID=36882 /ORGANISM="Pyramimonas amylifera, Strain CCMP720" /LENGTH=290 /DNA_ID=CAMNT_0041919927 /DNA_START=648 /DNA_END=1520 /DNA_ORIENTATION=+
MSGDGGAKAADLVKKADKKLASWTFFSNKYEEAAELFEQAANSFKLAKLWAEAGEVYLKLADCQIKLESKHETASAYVDAANSFKKVSAPRAVECLERAVEAFTELGRLSLAAKHHKDLAEMHEADAHIEKAMFHYEQAAELYEGEEQSSTANSCKLKLAQLAAQLELYTKAIEIYEQVALASLDNNLLKFSVKNYLLNSGLCQLCRNDSIAVSNALERYQEMDPSFGSTRECKFLLDLAQAMEEGDVQQFTNVIAEFDSMSRLDNWKTTVLLAAKRLVAQREGGAEDLT